MMRHTRSLLEIYRERGELQKNLAAREILPIPQITFTPAEKRAYDELETYCNELSEQVNRYADKQIKYQVGFYKSFLRLRFASSFYAITETVRRRKDKVHDTLRYLKAGEESPHTPDVSDYESLVMDPEEEEGREAEEAVLKNRTIEDLQWEAQALEELLGALERLSGPSSKMEELFKILEKRRKGNSSRMEQTVIFTRFYDTLTEIVRQLQAREPNILIGTYSGQGGQYTNPRSGELLRVDREQVKHLFLRGEVDVLVCTDAAAEGLNLQTANLIINYDLPWNPMKVEQRIGRLDRIGQKHDHVFVLNLCYLGSNEEIVYGRLLHRLSKAGMIVGTQQLSMLPVTPEEFRALADGELDEEELAKRASRRAEAQQERTRSMEIPPHERYEIYQRLEEETQAEPPPVDLPAIWETLSESRYLRDLGGTLSDQTGRQVFTLCGVEDVPEKTHFTISRELFEEGLPEEGGRLHFASYGDPYFDALLREIGRYDLPPCIRRVRAQVKGLPMEVVGYAVVTRAADGAREVKLVTFWQDLDGLEIDEDGRVLDQEVDVLCEQLRRQAREEFEVTRMAEAIERENIKAGQAQLAFAHLLGRGLIRDSAKDSAKFTYASVTKDLEALLDRERGMSVSGMPVRDLQLIQGKLLSPLTVPSMGAQTTIFVRLPELRSALDAVYREADRMKAGRSHISTDQMIDRLDRRIEEALNAFKEG
jgi:superfamily II DNA or RNA helicase